MTNPPATTWATEDERAYSLSVGRHVTQAGAAGCDGTAPASLRDPGDECDCEACR